MKVSVIIPCLNHAQEVGQAIQSALDQTRPPDEIIVVDDGSTDDSARAISQFGHRVTLLSQQQQGPSAARNLAARRAGGEWLALLDADDLWLPQKLAAQLDCLGKSPAAALIHTDGWVIDGHELPAGYENQRSFFATRVPPEGTEAYKIFMTTPLLTSSVMIRSDVFQKEQGFDENFRINEDADLFLRIMAQGLMTAYVPRPLMIQRCFPGGLGRDQLAYLEHSVRVLKKNLGRFPKLKKVLRRSLGEACQISAWYAIRADRAEMARRYWLRSLLYRRPGPRELVTAALLLFGGDRGKDAAARMWKDVIDRLR